MAGRTAPCRRARARRAQRTRHRAAKPPNRAPGPSNRRRWRRVRAAARPARAARRRRPAAGSSVRVYERARAVLLFIALARFVGFFGAARFTGFFFAGLIAVGFVFFGLALLALVLADDRLGGTAR